MPIKCASNSPSGSQQSHYSMDNFRVENNTEMAAEKGIPEKEAISKLIDMWGGCLRVAHNRTFDQRLIRIGLKRFFDEDAQEKWADKTNFDCSMMMSKPILQIPGKRGFKWPTLKEAYLHFMKEEMEGAHNAMADTEACMAVYWAMKDIETEETD